MPAAVVRLAERLSPWREGENAKAYAFDSDHRHLTDEPFTSGQARWTSRSPAVREWARAFSRGGVRRR